MAETKIIEKRLSTVAIDYEKNKVWKTKVVKYNRKFHNGEFKPTVERRVRIQASEDKHVEEDNYNEAEICGQNFL